jgi:hypothetical protein
LRRVEKERRIWHACTHTERGRTVGCFIFLEIVSNQPEKEATTRRNLRHSFFSILHFSLVSLSPSLIFPSCRFHHFLDRQRAARSRRMMMMMMTTTTTTMPLSVTTRRSYSNDDDDDDDDDDAKSIPSYALAIAR